MAAIDKTSGIKIHLRNEVIYNLYDSSEERDLEFNRLFDNLTQIDATGLNILL